MSLRSQLEAKQRRRCVVPVPVADPGPARRRLEAAQQALAAAAVSPDLAAAGEALQADVEAAQADLAATVVDIDLQAPPATDYEAVIAGHVDADGETDYTAALPQLLELCAVDPELQDADWWRSRLASPEWGPNDVAGLRLGVLYLVSDPIRPVLPKG